MLILFLLSPLKLNALLIFPEGKVLHYCFLKRLITFLNIIMLEGTIYFLPRIWAIKIFCLIYI